MLAFLGVVGALFIHAVRTGEKKNRHGWLVIVPLLFMVGWLIEHLIMGSN